MSLRPDDFWAMTLREWRAAVRGYAKRAGFGGPVARPLSSNRLRELMGQFPDAPSAPASAVE